MSKEEELIGQPIGNVPQREPGENCNGRRMDRDADPIEFVGYCQQNAGTRTEHPGEGRCWLHGGATPRGRDSPHWEHGLFSDHLSSEDRENLKRIEEMENASKLQSIINYEILRLRRAVRELEEESEDDDRGTFWEAFERIVDEAASSGLDSDDIREIAGLFSSSEGSFGSRVERIRRLTKTYEDITAGQKVNIDGDIRSEVSGPGGDALEISWVETPEEETENDAENEEASDT